MDIVVTGATGQAGSRVTDHFAEQGHEVLGVDRQRPPGERENVEFRPIDVTDYGDILEVILETEPDAVVHFAGLRSDRGAGNHIFETNVAGTYNVVDAAGRVGADVVWASSASVYGRLLPDQIPEYVPIDESHPTRPKRPYTISKHTAETAVESLVCRHDVSVVSMRATYIMYPGWYTSTEIDPDESGYDNSDLWSYIDVRDVVSFVDAAVQADIDGHEIFNVAAPDNRAGRPTRELLSWVYGDCPESCAVSGEESVYSIEKARDRLDWTPDHDWRTGARETPEPPAFISAE